MKLLELNPRWLMRGAERAGFVFLCPHCQKTTLVCTIIELSTKEQFALLREKFPEIVRDIVTAKANIAWKISGSMDFSGMYVTPSIDASTSGHWHGWIKNGEIA